MDARARASRIRLIAFDVDGVMTDGGLCYTDDGRELKTFDVQDGLGLKLLQRGDIELAIVTGRSSGVVAARAARSPAKAWSNASTPRSTTTDCERYQRGGASRGQTGPSLTASFSVQITPDVPDASVAMAVASATLYVW